VDTSFIRQQGGRRQGPLPLPSIIDAGLLSGTPPSLLHHGSVVASRERAGILSDAPPFLLRLGPGIAVAGM
jgi:hypothetical protein